MLLNIIISIYVIGWGVFTHRYYKRLDKVYDDTPPVTYSINLPIKYSTGLTHIIVKSLVASVVSLFWPLWLLGLKITPNIEYINKDTDNGK